MKIIDDHKPIYLTNLQVDIHNAIDEMGNSMLQDFYGMQTTVPTQDDVAQTYPLLHSVHNMSRLITNDALVSSLYYNDAIGQFTNLGNILRNDVKDEAFHSNIFIPGQTPGISGPRTDSVSSCNYSSYATELLNMFNLQDSTLETFTPSPKQNSSPPLL